MSLIKDGKTYRTFEEQLDHLTSVHEQQIVLNNSFSQLIMDLGIASNLGGYNLVRFSFQTQGQFFQIANNLFSSNLIGDYMDYVEISSFNSNDIPAYGYYESGNTVRLVFTGDFSNNYEELTIINVTKKTNSIIKPQYNSFEGTSLNSYNANNNKKQLFNVLTDLKYNSSTQYVSFDLNNDGIYNFVYIGVNKSGIDGASVYTVNSNNFNTIKNKLKIFDSIIISDMIPDFPMGVIGDVFQKSNENDGILIKIGNIRGQTGIKGDIGQTGNQGVQGIQGIQGIKGEKGDKGDKGEIGERGLILHTGILTSQSLLPVFSSANIGDAYTVINTGGQIVTYDLYYKTIDGIDWDILPNFGGIKGDKGDQGERGLQGIQGVKGEKGDKGDKGEDGAIGETVKYNSVFYISHLPDWDPDYYKVPITAFNTTTPSNGDLIIDENNGKISKIIEVIEEEGMVAVKDLFNPLYKNNIRFTVSTYWAMFYVTTDFISRTPLLSIDDFFRELYLSAHFSGNQEIPISGFISTDKAGVTILYASYKYALNAITGEMMLGSGEIIDFTIDFPDSIFYHCHYSLLYSTLNRV